MYRIIIILFLVSIQPHFGFSKPAKKDFLKKSVINDLKHLKSYPINAFQLQVNDNIYLIGQRMKLTFAIPHPMGVFAKARYRTSIVTLDNKLNFISEKKLNYKKVDGLSNPFFTGGINLFYLSFVSTKSAFNNQFNILKWDNTVFAFCPKKYHRSVLYKMDIDLQKTEIYNLKEFIHIKNEENKKIYQVDYKYKFSADSNYLCIICKYRYYHSYNERISIWLYTKNFKLKYSTDFQFSKGLHNSQLNTFIVNNYGEIVLAKTFYKKKRKVIFDSSEVFFIDAENLQPIREIIRSKDNLFINPCIKYNRFQNPVMMCMYGDSKKTKGFLISNFREDLTLNKLKRLQFKNFPINHLQNNSENETNSKFFNAESKKNLSFNEFIQTEDSSYILISNYYKFSFNQTRFRSNTDAYSIFEMYNDDLAYEYGYTHLMGNFVIAKLDKKKNPIWITEVDRNLIELSYSIHPTPYSGYLRYIKNGKLTLIYADNLKENGKIRKFALWRRIYSRVAEIDLKNGNVEVLNLFNDKMQKESVVLPNNIFKINNNQFLFLAFKKSTQFEGISSTNYLLKTILYDLNTPTIIKKK